jgi:hypothetical protein
VIVWLWWAGSAEGVTDSRRTARGRAVSFLRGTGATAILEMAYFNDGVRSLGAGYDRAHGAPCWVARRLPGGRVNWTLRHAEPELAAAS